MGLRRISAILLLALFSFSLIAPAFPADADANLPACCRRAGKHHCAMATGPGGGKTSSGPAFTAGGRCPYFPSAFPTATNPGSFAIAASRGTFKPLTGHADVIRSIPAHVSVSFSRSHQKRGPPSFLSCN